MFPGTEANFLRAQVSARGWLLREMLLVEDRVHATHRWPEPWFVCIRPGAS